MQNKIPPANKLKYFSFVLAIATVGCAIAFSVTYAFTVNFILSYAV